MFKTNTLALLSVSGLVEVYNSIHLKLGATGVDSVKENYKCIPCLPIALFLDI